MYPWQHVNIKSIHIYLKKKSTVPDMILWHRVKNANCLGKDRWLEHKTQSAYLMYNWLTQPMEASNVPTPALPFTPQP
jgi:hypothetical protein